jgi:excinuclease UvrABC ATPase subunit
MTNRGGGEFMLTLLAAQAQDESHNTSLRIKFSKKFNAEKGKVPNLVFGYDKVNGDYFHLNINEKESETVRFIFRKYTEDGDGTLKIAQTLNAMGIKTKRGCEWSQNAVARILTNSIYIGKIVNGKQEITNFPDSKRVNKDEADFITVQNDALKIIDEKTFEKAQNLLEVRRTAFQTNKTRHSNQYLFSTLIKCADCGWSFRRIQRTYQNTYVKWVCSARNGHGTDSCENAVSIDENILIEELQKYFSSLLSNREHYIEKAKEEFLRSRKIDADQNLKKETLEKELAQMKKKKEKMMNLYMADCISLEEFQKNTAAIKAEIPRLEYELQKLSIAPDKKAFEKAIDSVFQNIENITDIRKLSNSQLKEIIREIRVDKDGHIDIYLNTLT